MSLPINAQTATKMNFAFPAPGASSHHKAWPTFLCGHQLEGAQETFWNIVWIYIFLWTDRMMTRFRSWWHTSWRCNVYLQRINWMFSEGSISKGTWRGTRRIASTSDLLMNGSFGVSNPLLWTPQSSKDHDVFLRSSTRKHPGGLIFWFRIQGFYRYAHQVHSESKRFNRSFPFCEFL